MSALPQVSTAPYDELATAMRGELILPGDAAFEEARQVYNAMIDKYPAAIAQTRDTGDVIAAVSFARRYGLEIAVRSGGHNAAGLGVWDDALVMWTPERYAEKLRRPDGLTVTVLTPQPIVECFRLGYVPGTHDSLRNL